MICATCGQHVEARKGIQCHLCGRPFHFWHEKSCGYALPNPYACCGLVYACAACAVELTQRLAIASA